MVTGTLAHAAVPRPGRRRRLIRPYGCSTSWPPELAGSAGRMRGRSGEDRNTRPRSRGGLTLLCSSRRWAWPTAARRIRPACETRAIPRIRPPAKPSGRRSTARMGAPCARACCRIDESAVKRRARQAIARRPARGRWPGWVSARRWTSPRALEGSAISETPARDPRARAPTMGEGYCALGLRPIANRGPRPTWLLDAFRKRNSRRRRDGIGATRCPKRGIAMTPSRAP